MQGPRSCSASSTASSTIPCRRWCFLWDSFDRDEKLVLALLAESLADERAFATQKDLSRTILAGRYPFDLDLARISIALEKLFKSEMLLKNDATPPAYAFRMDLWRLWIRRMHSVWQVMREEGLSIRELRSRRRERLRIALPAAVVAALLLFGGLWLGRVRRPAAPGEPGPSPAPRGGAYSGTGGSGDLTLRTLPATATIRLEGRSVAIGTYEDSLPAGTALRFAVVAPGYADSSFTLAVEKHRPLDVTVALRPRRGDLYITTDPPGAAIRVDGTPRGTSPVLVSGLLAPDPHVVEAALTGRNPARENGCVPIPR